MPARAFRKPAGERRDRCVKSYFTPDEFAQLQTAAEASGMTHAAFVRACALGEKPKAKRSRASAELIRHLTYIGNNLNQMTKIAHAGRAPAEDLLEHTLHELLRAVRRIG